MDGRSCPCAFDNNGRFLALLTPDGCLKVWDCSDGVLKHQYTPSSHLSLTCTCLKWTNSSRGSATPRRKRQKTSHQSSSSPTVISVIALGTSTGDILIYDISEGEIQQRLTDSHTDRVNGLAWDLNGSLYSCSSDKHIVEWCVDKAEQKSKWKADRHAVNSICVSPLGNCLLSAGRAIKLWDLETKELLKKFTGHASPVSELCFLSSPSMPDSNANHVSEKSISGLYFLSGSKDERLLNVWYVDLESKEKNALISLSLSENPTTVDVAQYDVKERSVHVAVTSSDGYLHIFEKNLNGGGKKPLSPTRSIHLTTPDKNKSSIPFICSKLLSAKEPSVMVAYGSLAKPQFETLAYSSYESETCLTRENLSSLSIKQHSEPTGPVDKADRRVPEPSSLGPSSFAIARPSTAQNGAKGGQSLLPSTTDIAQQSLEDRLKAMTHVPKDKTFSRRKTPTASSMVQMLSQALHSEDHHLLEGVLNGVNKGNLIRNTIRKLPVQFILPLIKELIYRIQLSPNRGGMLAIWLKYILNIHMSYLMAVPNVVESLSSLYTMMETRVGVYSKLCKLQGRLDLVLSQVDKQNESHLDEQSLDTPLAVYDEEDSEEDDVHVAGSLGLEGEQSDSEDKWDEDMEDEGDISSDSEEEEDNETAKNEDDNDSDDDDDDED